MSIRVPPDDTGKIVRTRTFGGSITGNEIQIIELAAPNVDTGITAPASVALVDAPGIANDDDILLDGVAAVNNSGAAATVGVANGADQYVIAPFELADKATVHIPCYGRPVTGLKWRAPASVILQAWGRK